MPLIFTAAGFALLLYQFLVYKKIWDVKKWKSTECIITKSELESKEVSGRSGSGDYSFKKITVTRANVEYLYRVDGKEYKSEQIGLRKKRWHQEGLHSHEMSKGMLAGYLPPDEILGKYPLGAEITAFFNPKKPYESILLVDLELSSAYLGIAISLILIVFGIGAYLTI